MCVCVHVCVCVPGMCQPLSAPRGGGGGAHPVPVPLGSRTSCVPPELGSQAPPLPGHPLPPVWLPALPPWAQLGFAIAHISWGSFVDRGSSLALSLWLLNEAGGERVHGPGCPRQDAQFQGQETQPADPTQPRRQQGPGCPPLLHLDMFPLWPFAQPGANPAQGCLGLSLLSPAAGDLAWSSLRLGPLLCDTGDAGRPCPAGAELGVGGIGQRPAAGAPGGAAGLPPPCPHGLSCLLPGLLTPAPAFLDFTGPLSGWDAVLTGPPSLPQGERGLQGP